MDEQTYPLPGEISGTIDEEWARIASPGTWWRGEERVAIASCARAARAGDPPDEIDLPDTARSAIAQIATAAHTIEEATVRGWQSAGLGPLPLVELLAITAKTTTIDTFMEGVGTAMRGLPEPEEGEPTREKVEGAKVDHGWLPTKGPAGAPNCFSAVDAEHRSMHGMHSSFYLALQEMREMDVVKGLHRAQMELLAARTSYLNDCFY